jgi:hypothetical protein
VFAAYFIQNGAVVKPLVALNPLQADGYRGVGWVRSCRSGRIWQT